MKVLTNPDYERRHRQIWYYPVDQGDGKDSPSTMSDGELVQYKFHIALDPATYKSGANPSRDIVATFLSKNNIDHKCGGQKLEDAYMKPGDQHGKMFTVYCSSLKDFYIVAKGMQQLVKKYKLEGIPLEKIKAGGGNQQYERVVPNTNNTLYYTVERATHEAVYTAVRSLRPEWILKDEIDSWGQWEMGLEAIPGLRGAIGSTYGEKYHDHGAHEIAGKPAFYMGGSKGGYLLREVVMEHYWGQGPIDFLWD